MKQLFPSLPEAPKLSDVFRRFPDTVRPLLELTDAVMRRDSALTVGERELIAAYVSGLNACRFCMDGHEVYARAHGVDPALIAALLDDPEGADIDGRLRPLLAYVAKLTREPSKMVEADAQAVYAAGWTEEALYDAIQTCALFNLMNRVIEGTGVPPMLPDPDRPEGAPLPRMDSYLAFGRTLGVV
ncbi:peroxidase-related enzyme [Aestuariicoccus sp. MJ-SS9]|uniref:carboxymuconolactone decarboxylase family protein n=1 Tax=Aestuariicoccus sp. MJ-SS9 TaxID=3079855 RepID=UPI00290DA15C|nr:peroxidase-related enzyme [Aestuariicoccus sp. MJ-SS9]MDU8912638.1 peroxidase-related enzyme [Aestuariicoccus sp. MJ-SS9]